jgi:aspartate aminotransferase
MESSSAFSQLAENNKVSEIIQIAVAVREKIAKGEKIFNLTIGDFDPNIYPIPDELKEGVINAYKNNQTNYPPPDGLPELREAIVKLLKERGELDYDTKEIAISGGARPVIYATYLTLVDEGDTVLFPVPSWNNNHYSDLIKGKQVFFETSAENNFMPTAADLKPHIKEARMIALCSPLNPTGTTIKKKDLEEICDLVLAENSARKEAGEKPLYLMYDQIYWALTHGDTVHYNPVSLRPEMKEYTINIDGISKSLSATGVRVGWAMASKAVIGKMIPILTHIGAWAPKPEQLATANYLNNLDKYDAFIADIKTKITASLTGLYDGFKTLKLEGFKVDAIAPEAAIYLTVQFALHGKTTANGQVLKTTEAITQYLLDEAKVAVVPFYAFGASRDSDWFRISVGTCKPEDINEIIESLRSVFKLLK